MTINWALFLFFYDDSQHNNMLSSSSIFVMQFRILCSYWTRLYAFLEFLQKPFLSTFSAKQNFSIRQIPGYQLGVLTSRQTNCLLSVVNRAKIRLEAIFLKLSYFLQMTFFNEKNQILFKALFLV